MKNKSYFLLITIVVVAAFVLFIMVFQARSQSIASMPTRTPAGLVTIAPNKPTTYVELTPTPELDIIDLAPKSGDFDKAVIIIQQGDGNQTKILLLPDMIDGFINQLPKEYKINVIIPPQSIIGHEPPKVYPPVEDQIYEGSIETIIGTPPSSH